VGRVRCAARPPFFGAGIVAEVHLSSRAERAAVALQRLQARFARR